MKKELFKRIIKEFQEKPLPQLKERELELPETKKIITLVGPRRSGKTFYFFQLIKKLNKEKVVYINFEDDRLFPLELKDLDEILEAYEELYPENKDQLYLLIDEIQNIKNWELYIRRINDNKNIKIFITGSSSKLLSQEIATSLRGRTLTFNLFPLSFKEFLKFNEFELKKDSFYTNDRHKIKKFLEKYTNLGGFPEIVLEKNNLEQQILTNYFEVMIYRDIIERFSIRNINLLKTLAKYLLTNIASYFSTNSYYKILKEKENVSKDSLFQYISYLEEANIIFLIPLFSYSLKVQQTNNKKIYCIDNGLRNAISFKFSEDEGKLLENLVFIELKRKNYEIFYYKKNKECDFIVKTNKQLEAIQVCVEINEGNEKREIDGLLEVLKEFKIEKGLILTKNQEDLMIIEGKKIYIKRIDKWLLE
ncbi:MAG TPA: ATP-binding protein [Candidatus Nanoarchaeia archaeon]|nr:ATP-binding protein [Candidatus Nanoarchaeia archaeon]